MAWVQLLEKEVVFEVLGRNTECTGEKVLAKIVLLIHYSLIQFFTVLLNQEHLVIFKNSLKINSLQNCHQSHS